MTTGSAVREWVKSSYSGAQHGSDCLEWAPSSAPVGVVPVRDSKNPGPEIHFSTEAWTTFVRLVRR
ncbi:hypothetical protein SSP35_03_05420 [Streptomyces sp. NBRC 110611]|uniref:DUF397 domain-containing protein n=1 Tax=Streptomyces sp. NBRC 110611 TaxID=1621259 RepID=UPI00082EBC83|nr:DUF397 domain-containing protein [Streptomyces sp. NBRC 110611]GAU66893.1 hypothetical protein SSP35_03_05420 [Streptomyces sp. NBRC 110611]